MTETTLPPPVSTATTGHFELQGTRAGHLRLAYGRIVLISALFTLAYLGILIRAFDVMVIEGAFRSFEDTADAQQVVDKVATPRRDIVDRNGMLLATSIKTASLYADQKLILDAEKTAKGLSKIFPDQPYGTLLQKLQGDKRFVWIKRNLSPSEQAAILELGQPGLSFQEEYRRLYPQGPLTAHMVGYNDVDGQGIAGIEQGLNKVLTRSGEAITLTLDVRLQHILRREIQKTMADFTAVGGAGIIMDARSGDVLAAVSLPDFDPHVAGSAKDEAKFNRTTLGTYELGSCFKIFSTAALIDQQNPPFSTAFDTRNPIKVGRFTISDFHPENRTLTLPEVFMYSSNIGTAMMAQRIGTDGLKTFYDDLGFMKPIAFDTPEIGKPLVPHPWREVSTLTASYGHGIAITPLQLAAATATVIGDGRWVQPHLVKKPDGAMEKGERIVSENTATKMRALLRLVVKHGTGSKAEVPGLMMGGKTGTAEKSINGRYVHNALISSFVGAFPMNDPRYVIMVSVDSPRPNKSSFGYATAGWTAAPAAGRVAASMARVLGIVPDLNAKDIADPLTRYLAEFRDQDVSASSSPLKATPIASVTSDPN